MQFSSVKTLTKREEAAVAAVSEEFVAAPVPERVAAAVEVSEQVAAATAVWN